MDHQILIEKMADNVRSIQQLVDGISPAQAVWKPRPEDWSILEVITHLADEERLDFRVRLDLMLHDPQTAWPPIDPGGWVTARRYQQRLLAVSLKNFVEERSASLAWLRSLEDPDWQAGVEAPWGRLTAGEMFAAWVTHDTLHMRQLVELIHAWIVRQAEPYDPQYAGDW